MLKVSSKSTHKVNLRINSSDDDQSVENERVNQLHNDHDDVSASSTASTSGDEFCTLKKKDYHELEARIKMLEESVSPNPSTNTISFESLNIEERRVFQRLVFEVGIPNAFRKINHNKQLFVELENLIERLDLSNNLEISKTQLMKHLEHCKLDHSFKNNQVSNKINSFRRNVVQKCLISLWLLEDSKGHFGFKQAIGDGNLKLTLFDVHLCVGVIAGNKTFEQIKEKHPKSSLSKV